MKADLIIHLDVGPDRDLRELEGLSANLRSELRRLDEVESVQPLPLGEAAAGSKVADPLSAGAILMTLLASKGVVVSMLGLLAVWLGRGDHRSLTIQVGQSKFEMKGGSANERNELAERILQELHPEGPLCRRDGERFGLLVASSEFQSETLRRLSAPPADVEALADVLRRSDVGGFNVKTLVNQPRQAVELAIQSFFRERKRNDLVLLYFSGHGLKDDSNNLYLAMTDTTRRYLESTAVSSRFVREMMQNCPARRQILLLDCCFSGAFPRGWTFRADEAIGSGHYFEAKGSGQAILTASDDMQYAFEGDEVTMQKVAPSMFTEIVVRGITNGEADIDLDGNITIDDLHGYVLEQLRTRNSRQNPQKWYFGLTEDIVLAANPNPHVRALVEELRSRIESEDVRLRLAAVHDLGNLARRSDGRRRLAAIKALEALTKDDSKAVSAAARATLGDLLEQAQEEVGQNKGQTSGENDNMEEQPPAGAATSARQASKRKPDETIAQDPRLRFAVRFSFVPFVLVLLSYLLPFYHELGNPLQFGHEYLWDLVVYFSNPRPVEGRILFNEIALFLAFLCPIFVLCSHFLKYRWKAVLEVVVSWICFVLLATWILNPLENVPYGRMGAFLACTFAAAGAVVKTFLLIHWRKLTKI